MLFCCQQGKLVQVMEQLFGEDLANNRRETDGHELPCACCPVVFSTVVAILRRQSSGPCAV